jgi:Ca-activated chloride channel homolog
MQPNFEMSKVSNFLHGQVLIADKSVMTYQEHELCYEYVNEVFMTRLSVRGFSRSSEAPPLSSDPTCARKISVRLPFGVNLVCLLLFISAAIGGFPLLCTAQVSDVEDVHVTPRIKPADTAKNEVVDAALKTHTKPMLVDVDLVLVPVTITDPMNRLVTGLDKGNFNVYEGKDPQEIRSFSSEDAPVSLGIVFDMSGSMSSKIDRAREAVGEFLKTANPQDEFFLIAFSDQPEQLSDFTQVADEIQNKLMFTAPRGRTSLLDAIYLGVHKMRQAKYPKRALLIISDGGDNHSRYTEGEIKSTVKEADLLVYAIGIYDHYFASPEEQLGPALLTEISELTGGRAFTIDNPNDLADVATKIGTELRNQYVIGYRPKNRAHDGKWRKIRVKLTPPKGLPPLRVYAKTGYYAPSE